MKIKLKGRPTADTHIEEEFCKIGDDPGFEEFTPRIYPTAPRTNLQLDSHVFPPKMSSW